jgi:hypothetical protein
MALKSCTKCFWPLQTEDVYCSGCGTKLLEFIVNPDPETTVYVVEGRDRTIELHNNGDTQIKVNSLQIQKEDNVFDPVDIDEIVESNESLKMSPNIDSYGFRRGDKGRIEIKTEPQLFDDSLYLNFIVIEEPEINIVLSVSGFPDSVFKIDDVWHIDAIKEINRVSVTPKLLFKQGDYDIKPEITACFDSGNNDIYSSDLIEINKLPQNEDSTLIFKVGVAGTVLEKKVIVKKVRLPQLENKKELNNDRHNCKVYFGEKSHLETSHELVDGAKKRRFLTLNFCYERHDGVDVRVDKCQTDDNIVVNNQTVPAGSGWLTVCEDDTWKKSAEKLFNDKNNAGFSLKFHIYVNKLGSLRQYSTDGKSTRFSTSVKIDYIISYNGIELVRSLIERINFIIYFHQKIDIVVDFGTSNTCVAYLNEETESKELLSVERHQFDDIFRDEHKYLDENRELPSIFRFDEFPIDYEAGGRKKIGQEKISAGEFIKMVTAHTTTDLVLASTCSSFKTMLISDSHIPRSDKAGRHHLDFKSNEICAVFMKYIFDFIRETIPGEVDSVNCTFPVSFSKKEKNNLQKALEIAGVDRKKICMDVPEPVGLAIDYVRNYISNHGDLKEGDSKIIAIFDCGGGTTDISVAKLYKAEGFRKLKFLAGAGVGDMGGDKFDYLIAKKVALNITEVAKKKVLFPYENFVNRMILRGKEQSNYSVLLECARNIKENLMDDLLSKGKLFIDSVLSNHIYFEGEESPQLLSIIKGEPLEFTVNDFYDAVDPEIKRGMAILRDIGSVLLSNGLIETTNADNNIGHFYPDRSSSVSAFYDMTKGELTFFKTENGQKLEILKKEIKKLTVPGIYEIYYEELYMNSAVDYPERFSKIEISGIGELPNGFKDRCREFGIVKVELLDSRSEKSDVYYDTLILGGNSCKMTRIKEIADEEVLSREECVYDPENAKRSVVLGAADYYIDPENLPFYIEDVKMTTFALCFKQQGQLIPILPQWTPDGKKNAKKTQPVKVTKNEIKRGKKVYEDKNPLRVSSTAYGNGDVVVGTIEFSENLLDKWVVFEFYSENGEYYFKRFVGDKEEDDFNEAYDAGYVKLAENE